MILFKKIILVYFLSNSIGLCDEIFQVAFPDKALVKEGESIKLLIKVKNRSKKNVIIPSGVIDALGRCAPNEYDFKIVLYDKTKDGIEETQRTLDFKASNNDAPGKILKPGESVLYIVCLVPFEKGSKGDYCLIILNIEHNSNIKPVKINVQRSK